MVESRPGWANPLENGLFGHQGTAGLEQCGVSVNEGVGKGRGWPDPLGGHHGSLEVQSVQSPPRLGQHTSVPEKKGAGSSHLSSHLSQRAYLSQGPVAFVCELYLWDHMIPEYALCISSVQCIFIEHLLGARYNTKHKLRG